MTGAAPTILALETHSAFVVVLVVTAVTLPAALIMRRLIGRPGGVASGLLLGLPLLLPLVAAIAYQGALLPEIAVLRPAREVVSGGTRELLHLFYFSQGETRIPYVLWGQASGWVLLVGLGASSLMLVRRALGATLVKAMLRRCEPPPEPLRSRLDALVDDLSRRAGLTRRPEVLLLPEGVHGAFAVGAFRPRILIARELLEALDDDELDGILAHEIAHIEARDVSLLVVAGVLRDMLAWNPLAHVAYRSLSGDREMEADRRAAAMTGRPLAVASGLVKTCDLMRARSRRGRLAAVAFLRPGGRVARRVDRLLAVADGRVALRTEGRVPYLAAAAVVAVMGLQVGARLTEERGGFAIVWGAPEVAAGGMYAPKPPPIPRDIGEAGKGKEATRAELESPQRGPKLARIATVRAGDVDAWAADMSSWLARKADRGISPVTYAWEARRDWEATPLRCPSGSFCIYRVDGM